VYVKKQIAHSNQTNTIINTNETASKTDINYTRRRENMLEIPKKRIYSDPIGKHVERLIIYIEMQCDYMRK
jgi:hypothetical protein